MKTFVELIIRFQTAKPFSLFEPKRSGCQKPCWTSPPTSSLLCALMDTHSCMCAHFTPKPQLKREWGFWLLMLIHAIWFNKGKFAILSFHFVDGMCYILHRRSKKNIRSWSNCWGFWLLNAHTYNFWFDKDKWS